MQTVIFQHEECGDVIEQQREQFETGARIIPGVFLLSLQEVAGQFAKASKNKILQHPGFCYEEVHYKSKINMMTFYKTRELINLKRKK